MVISSLLSQKRQSELANSPLLIQRRHAEIGNTGTCLPILFSGRLDWQPCALFSSQPYKTSQPDKTDRTRYSIFIPPVQDMHTSVPTDSVGTITTSQPDRITQKHAYVSRYHHNFTARQDRQNYQKCISTISRYHHHFSARLDRHRLDSRRGLPSQLPFTKGDKINSLSPSHSITKIILSGMGIPSLFPLGGRGGYVHSFTTFGLERQAAETGPQGHLW